MIFEVSLIHDCSKSNFWWEKNLLKRVYVKNKEELIDYLEKNEISCYNISIINDNVKNIDLTLPETKKYCIWWNRELEVYDRRVNNRYNHYNFNAKEILINHDKFDIYPSLVVANYINDKVANNAERIKKQFAMAILLEETGNVGISYKYINYFNKNFIGLLDEDTNMVFSSKSIWSFIDNKINKVMKENNGY